MGKTVGKIKKKKGHLYHVDGEGRIVERKATGRKKGSEGKATKKIEEVKQKEKKAREKLKQKIEKLKQKEKKKKK